MGLFGGKKKEDTVKIEEMNQLKEQVQGKSIPETTPTDFYICRRKMVASVTQTTPSGMIIQTPTSQTEIFEPLIPLTKEDLFRIIKDVDENKAIYEKIEWILTH
jgi:hypothetical protein